MKIGMHFAVLPVASGQGSKFWIYNFKTRMSARAEFRLPNDALIYTLSEVAGEATIFVFNRQANNF